VSVDGGATLTAEGCAIAANSLVGLLAFDEGTDVALLRSVVSDTRPDATGVFGMGVQVAAGAHLRIEDGAVTGNSTAGITAGNPLTHVELRDSVVRDTHLAADGSYGYGINAVLGATVTLEGSEIADNRGVGVLADGDATAIVVRDSLVHGTRRGIDDLSAAGAGILVQFGASVAAEGLVASENAGPGLVAMWGQAEATCTGCTLADNEFAGAVLVGDGNLELTSTVVSGTRESANLGGGVGVFATGKDGELWPTVSLANSTFADNPVAGAWLNGSGRFTVLGCTFSGSAGVPHGAGTRCGDGVYASATGSWGGSWGLLLGSNTIQDNAGAGVLLDAGSATLSGNAWGGNDLDLVAQGPSCAEDAETYDEAPAREVCPLWDRPTCALEFSFDLEIADLATERPPPPSRHRARATRSAGPAPRRGAP
jgi:hypothetical protein